VKIINTTKNIVLADDAIIAATVFKRLKGLLGRKSIENGEALVIRPCNSIHTFFMRFPIDVLFVDKANKVIAVLNTFPSFRVSKIYFSAAYVIELPAGSLKTTSTSVSDQLEIV
jgi:uncharacterized protein